MPEAARARRLHEDDYDYEPYLSVAPDAPARRTVRITGQPTPARRRSATPNHIRARPDRIVMWAFLLGLFLIFMAVVTASV